MIIEESAVQAMSDLLTRFPILKEVNTTQEHEQALELMESLLDDYDRNFLLIEALSSSIERYEEISPEFLGFNGTVENLNKGTAVLRMLMDQHALKTNDFENEIGKKSMVSQVLSGKKNLTKEHIARLSARFNLCPSVFF